MRRIALARNRILAEVVSAPPPYVAEAVNCNGATFRRNAALSGASNSANGLLSFWIGNHTDQGGNPLFRTWANSGFSGSSQGVFVEDDGTAGKNANIRLASSSGTTLFNSSFITEGIDDGNWHHILAAWELDGTPVVQIYIDDSAATYSPTTNPVTGSVGWTAPSLGVSPHTWYEGDMSEFYTTNEYLDISIESNRRKFISASGTPVFLGSDGSVPTGTQAIIYVTGGASVWNAGTNAGSGGNFTDGTANFTDSSFEPVAL